MSDYCYYLTDETIGDAEPVHFHTRKSVKARKEHKCSECQRTIEPGETYERATVIFEKGDKPCVDATCADCIETRGQLHNKGVYPMPGSVGCTYKALINGEIEDVKP